MPRQELAFRGFTYASVPAGAQPTHVDWRLLESGDVVSEHIRVHELTEEDLKEEGEGLLITLHEYQGAHAKAVVIVNLNETLTLPEGVGKKLEGLAGYPVVVITRSSGDRVLDCLQVEYEDEEVHAQLVVESMEEPQEDDLAILEQPTFTTSSSRPESHKEKGKYWRSSLTPTSLTSSSTFFSSSSSTTFSSLPPYRMVR